MTISTANRTSTSNSVARSRSQTSNASGDTAASNHAASTARVDTSSLAGIERASSGEHNRADESPLDSLAKQPTTGEQLSNADDHSENNVPNAVLGRAGATGRDAFVSRQSDRAYDIGRNSPTVPYSDAVFRAVPDITRRTQGYADFTYSDSGGRYGRAGETVIYNSETQAGVKAEAANYDGLANQAVFKSDYSGNIVDVVGAKQISEGALSEPYGDEGRHRGIFSKFTGEDPYTHARALSDGARAQGAEALRVPANNGHVNVNILPENNTALPSQYTYVEHTRFNDSGEPTKTVFDPATKLTPEGNSPGVSVSDPDNFRAGVSADAAAHSRASGARYGAAGATVFSTINAVSDGEVTLQEGGKVVFDGALGGGAALAADSLENTRLGAVKGGAVVDGVIAIGTSVWDNSDAVENGDMSAGDATADVVVDTGVAVTAGLTGMAAGAAVGSVIPIAGTATGAAIGFVVGAGGAWIASKTLEGSGVGEWVREELGDVLENNFEKPLKKAWTAVDEIKDNTLAAASETISSARDKISNAGKAVTGFIGGLFGN